MVEWKEHWMKYQNFVVLQSLSCIQFFVTPWTAARQTSLSITTFPEFAQTHVHRVGDAPTISSSVTPFSSCPHPCQHQGLFQSWLFTSGGHSIADAASVLQNTWVHRLGNPDDESRNFQGLGFFLSQMRGLN